MNHVVDVLRQAEKKLMGFNTARLDAEVLLANVLGKSRSYLLAFPYTIVSPNQLVKYQALIQQRQTKIPIAYLLNEKEFWSLPLQVNRNVLVPRPETELLVERILADYQTRQALTLIDLGTGSGAIAIALAHEKPQWTIIASDISQAALEIAEHNAKRLNCLSIRFVCSDWLNQLPTTLKVDVIVSNPPYLRPDDAYLLDSEIMHEPALALIAENCGLAAYQNIVRHAGNFLQQQGRIYFEHGACQAAAVHDILQQAGFSSIKNYRDLAGLPRVTIGLLTTPPVPAIFGENQVNKSKN